MFFLKTKNFLEKVNFFYTIKCKLSCRSYFNKNNIPNFLINRNNIIILNEPNLFYSKILELTQKAQKRIIFSSLYIGTDSLEQKLIESLHKQLNNNHNLKVIVLLDYTRANRVGTDNRSSKTLLLPLLNDHPQNLSINFYLSPKYKKKFYQNYLLPKQRLNEILSIQHIKIYVFDDDFIISGANLNSQYFTNRQDRYIYVKNCHDLSNYFEQLIQAICKISINLKPNESSTLSNRQFKSLDEINLKEDIQKINQRFLKKNMGKINEDDVLIFPLIQSKDFNIHEDENFTKSLLNNIPENSELKICSGYFNLTKDYQDLILKSSKNSNSSLEFIIPSEEVNSFYKSHGLSKYIPSVYSQLAKNFYNNVVRKKLVNIKFYLYSRENWTFHSKGLWLNCSDYFMSLIGSSNFGYRSVQRDLEMQLVILTKDKNLIKQFQDEYENIKKHTKLIESSKQFPYIPYWLKSITNLIKKFF